MEKKKKIVLYLIFSLIVWSIVALFAIQNPVPMEPENLSPETWSYYRDRSPLEIFLIKNRDAVLLVLFLCTIVPDVVFLIVEYTRRKR